MAQDRLETAEVGRYEVDVGAGVAKEPFGRPEEPAAVADALAHEQLVEVGQQGTEHLEALVVVGLAPGACMGERVAHLLNGRIIDFIKFDGSIAHSYVRSA